MKEAKKVKQKKLYYIEDELYVFTEPIIYKEVTAVRVVAGIAHTDLKKRFS